MVPVSAVHVWKSVYRLAERDDWWFLRVVFYKRAVQKKSETFLMCEA